MGDVTPEAQVRESTVAATAHRFSVLVPERLLPEEAAMVQRIVELEKPAHTGLRDAAATTTCSASARRGSGRTACSAMAGDSSPTVLDDGQYLAQGYLASAPPMDTTERFIADRDRPGDRAL